MIGEEAKVKLVMTRSRIFTMKFNDVAAELLALPTDEAATHDKSMFTLNDRSLSSGHKRQSGTEKGALSSRFVFIQQKPVIKREQSGVAVGPGNAR